MLLALAVRIEMDRKSLLAIKDIEPHVALLLGMQERHNHFLNKSDIVESR